MTLFVSDERGTLYAAMRDIERLDLGSPDIQAQVCSNIKTTLMGARLRVTPDGQTAESYRAEHHRLG